VLILHAKPKNVACVIDKTHDVAIGWIGTLGAVTHAEIARYPTDIAKFEPHGFGR
jgi:hypothetical protein